MRRGSQVEWLTPVVEGRGCTVISRAACTGQTAATKMRVALERVTTTLFYFMKLHSFL